MVERRRSRTFTLFELFALIFIIALMLGLLAPALQRNRHGPSHRNWCSNNMRQTTLALLAYEGTQGGFPGYANVVNHKRASWVVPLLPYVERLDLYQAWRDAPAVPLPLPAGATGTTLADGGPNPWAHSLVTILVCPRLPEPTDAPDPLSYVVNCGSSRAANDFLPPITSANTWVEDRNSGVFFNRARADVNLMRPNPNPPANVFDPDAGPTMTLDFIATHDGASNTLLMTENVQAGNWATDPTDTTRRPPYPFQSEFQIKQNAGFVWFVTGNKDNAGPAPASAAYNPAGIGVNQLRTASAPVPPMAYPIVGSDPPTGGLTYARPSSNHPGGVNAMFCDGHYSFISEEIDYRVYTQLMTPNGKEAIVELPEETAGAAGWDYQLNEADY